MIRVIIPTTSLFHVTRNTATDAHCVVIALRRSELNSLKDSRDSLTSRRVTV